MSKGPKSDCCQKSLSRKGAKFCSRCGRGLHLSLEGKESLFFAVSHLFDDHRRAEAFVEDYNKHGNLALDWYGIACR